MALNEVVVTGKYFRQLADKATKKWERYSLWSKASDTECDDGTNVETKVGAIKGITTSTNVTGTGYAADAKKVSELYNSLSANSASFNLDYQNDQWGWNESPARGADTFHPFSSGAKTELLWENTEDQTKGFAPQTVTFKENTYTHYIIEFWGRNNIRNVITTVLIESSYTGTAGYFGIKGGGCFYIAGKVSVSRNILSTTSHSVQFDSGYANNDYVIPSKIYGVNIIF